MNDRRLIEGWLPIAELSEECVRERRSMTALPPTYYLHVWWARRPLVASRAAVLASLLPEDADRKRFMHAIGIHGDPVAAKRRIDVATRKGERLGAAAYGYARAFKYSLSAEDLDWLTGMIGRASVLDPTAGGGSVPFESSRLRFETIANDLNPVAVLVELATVEWPMRFGEDVRADFEALGSKFVTRVRKRLQGVFPSDGIADTIPDGYLWARTVVCPYCHGLVPLSPNWRLAPGGKGVRVVPHPGSGSSKGGRICSFEIVRTAGEHSAGTVARGDGICPYGDCGRVIDGDQIKRQAREGRMGEQLFAVVYKRRVRTTLKSGKPGRDKWVREYRAPRPEDDNGAEIQDRLDQKLPEWEAFDMVPSERIPEGNKTAEPQRYGMRHWRDLFSPRQLLCHGTSVEVYREMLDADRASGRLSEIRKAAYGYLALSIDKLLNYNCRMTRWIVPREVVASKFDRHDFAFVWSYAEMAPLVVGVGYDWAIRQTSKCMRELVDLIGSESDASGSLPLGVGSEPTRTTEGHSAPIHVWGTRSQESITSACQTTSSIVRSVSFWIHRMYLFESQPRTRRSYSIHRARPRLVPDAVLSQNPHGRSGRESLRWFPPSSSDGTYRGTNETAHPPPR